MRHHALYQGRFQPPTKAHFSTLIAILKEWEFVTIGVIYFLRKVPEVAPEHQLYAERIRRPVRALNPLTLDERIALWDECLRRNGLRDRAACVACKPPHYDSDLNERFPPDRVDYVLPKSEPWEVTDYAREAELPGILKRPLLFAYPEYKMHISQIRSTIMKPDDWEAHLAPGTVELFRQMNGPSRMSPPD